MKFLAPLVISGLLTCFIAAESMDLGAIDQYNATLAVLPQEIEASAVWIGRGEGGYNIVLGNDTRARVQGVLEACDEVNNQCYQQIVTVLDSAIMQIDKVLDRRILFDAIGINFASFNLPSIFFAATTWVLLAKWKWEHENLRELGYLLPDRKAKEVGSLKSASATVITISAANTAVVTITQSSSPTTTLQGTTTPAVTAVTTSSDGYAAGDLAAILDKDLASRIDEIMHRSLDCMDGRAFDIQNPSKKRASGTFGQAICAAEAVAAGAVPGGPFNDLLRLNMAELRFRFAETAPAVLRAANFFGDFVQVYAPMIVVPADLAAELTTYIFALAIDTVMEGITLGEKNVIHSSTITTSISTSATTSSTPCPTSLVCGMKGEDCLLQMPKWGESWPTCKEGEHKDCRCNSPPIVFTNIASPKKQQAIFAASSLFGPTPAVANSPICPIIVTIVPKTLFNSDQSQVYLHFCEGWNADTASKMTVDSGGKNRNAEPHLNRKRTPPPNADTYRDWNFDLGFTPSKEGGKCQANCHEAYQQFGSSCASNAGGVYMYEQGTFDVGCGTFDFKISKPTTELKVFEQFCYQANDFGKLKGDVQGSTVSRNSGFACAGSALDAQKIKKGEKSTFIQLLVTQNNVPYQYNVWWKDGCSLDDGGPSEAYAANPLNVTDAGYTACQDMLVNNWKNCNNKGVGGNIQVGCLMYEFKADGNKRVF